jgi:hypothetical protein
MRLRGDLHSLHGYALAWRVGSSAMTFFVGLVKFIFIVVGFCVAGFWAEATYFSKIKAWSQEFVASAGLFVVFLIRAFVWNVQPHTTVLAIWIQMVGIVFSVALKATVYRLVESLRRKDVVGSPVITAFFVVVLLADSGAHTRIAFSIFATDQMRAERSGLVMCLVVDILLAILLVFQVRRAAENIDESEGERFWIYVIAVGFVVGWMIITRVLALFVLYFPLGLIPEVTVMTSQCAFTALLVYLHWTRGEGGREDYVDTVDSDVGKAKGGDSLFD